MNIVKELWDLVFCLSPNNHPQYCIDCMAASKERHGMYPPLQHIVPETHPPTRPLPLSHIPLSSLFISLRWITVIYSHVSFSWAITGVEEGWGLTGSWRLASLVFHLAIILSNRGPSHWYASYALVRHVALLLDFIERLLGSTSGNGDGIHSMHRQLLALQSPSHRLSLAFLLQQGNEACKMARRFSMNEWVKKAVDECLLWAS